MLVLNMGGLSSDATDEAESTWGSEQGGDPTFNEAESDVMQMRYD